MSRHFRSRTEREKEFIQIIDRLCRTRQKWQVWSDLITMMACALANSVDRSSGYYEKREKEYRECLERIGDLDLAARAFAVVVEELDTNPDQDFLGDLYMRLELGNHWRGQFFTPYSICQMMAGLQMSEAAAQVNQRGYISVCDPCIGGGAMLVAAASELKRQGVNYHTQAIFIGQDIDRIAGMMAFIQISLLGLPGYIVIANTLTNPLTGISDIEPVQNEGQEFWFTPFFYTDVWQTRRKLKAMDRLLQSLGSVAAPKEPAQPYTFFFNFEETDHGRDNRKDQRSA